MKANSLSQKVSLSRLRNDADDVLKLLNDEPLAITKYGKTVAYLIPADTYRILLQNSELNHQASGLLNIRAT
jgi:prevent-host-death family protein